MPDTPKKTPADYGPQQLAAHLGFEQWRFERALDLGLIPPADTNGGYRWSAAAVDALAAQADDIRKATGTLPDLGATRAAEHLADRFGLPADADTVAELARAGHLPRVGDFKGHTLYDGLTLERFTDRDALARAHRDGRLLDRHQAAEHMGIRPVDLAHLIRAGLLRPATHVRSRYQSRRSHPAIALYRRGTLDTLLADPAVDWDTVRATPKGGRSPLTALVPRTPV
ncbi:hypothetical protein ACFCZ6_14610 [Streptomyces hydrogenans]|uniref:hypothetical protein n=1 Tax=Streptomyces hydrogenans TaxID=1873719 RepID=UPI0035DF5547